MRCKFKLDSIERTSQVNGYETDANGKADMSKPIKREIQSLKFSPVYHNGDPAHENSKFWQWTPTGSLHIGTVNEEAVRGLQLGAEYYLDITPAA